MAKGERPMANGKSPRLRTLHSAHGLVIWSSLQWIISERMRGKAVISNRALGYLSPVDFENQII
jgi:hypothetical protein